MHMLTLLIPPPHLDSSRRWSCCGSWLCSRKAVGNRRNWRVVQTDLLGRCRRLENLDFAAGVVHAWQVGGFYEVFSAGPIG